MCASVDASCMPVGEWVQGIVSRMRVGHRSSHTMTCEDAEDPFEIGIWVSSSSFVSPHREAPVSPLDLYRPRDHLSQ